MAHFYDLLLAEYLQVWLHQVHLADAWAPNGEAHVRALVHLVLGQASQLPGAAHPNAPALLAALHVLARRAAQGPVPAAPVLKQELAAVLYTALRRSTAANGAPAAAPQAFAFSPPPEFAPRPSAADFVNWT
ncbi:hypothetical protein [Hymenobacter sp. PAMC 26628]|uniref:hypothetical protein n=1 Tax=Hymenobacter sp. PAMC 26628 TaxID=1484118 RepID=UPI00077049D4|nr:hypothetical protein [Hymenobacter sp. PAMC 26628]AMJ66058.1 hypothetical protein AXW84_11910 [Hymenobacter sp. PAMC 26628]